MREGHGGFEDVGALVGCIVVVVVVFIEFRVDGAALGLIEEVRFRLLPVGM